MKVAIYYNDYQQSGGINTYCQYLLTHLKDAPRISEVVFMVNDDVQPDKLNLDIPESIKVVSSDENVDAVMVITAAGNTGQNAWRDDLSKVDAPLVGVVHSWSDLTKPSLPKRACTLPNMTTYVSWFGNAKINNIRSRYGMQEGDRVYYHQHYYPMPDVVPNKSGVKVFIGARHVSSKERQVIDKIKSNYPTMEFIERGTGAGQSAYSPTEIVQLMSECTYFLLPAMGRYLEHDGTPDWVILEALSAGCLPIVYEPTLNTFEDGRYGFMFSSFNDDGMLTNMPIAGCTYPWASYMEHNYVSLSGCQREDMLKVWSEALLHAVSTYNHVGD